MSSSNVVVVRRATPADLQAINDIYNHYVLHSTTTYQIDPETMADREKWFTSRGPQHPVIVAELGGEIVGWGSLSRYHARAAYARTVENSVYVKDGWRGKGLGGLVLDRLLALAREHGHHSVIARVTGANEASLALHARHGFARVGHERQVAFKHGVWLDVVTLQRVLMD